MTQEQAPEKEFVIPNAPAIPGLRFRGFSGEADVPAIVAIITGCNEADGLENTITVEWLARNYDRLPNCDPCRDLLLVEVDGEPVGYGRVWWLQEKSRTRRYYQSALLLPPWRGQGIRRAMVQHNERRLREIAASHPEDGERFLDVWVEEGENDWERVLQKENEAHKRSRGYIEIIGVRPLWRRRGLARALLARSLRALQAQGMREAALSTDAQYRHGALRLYESTGFQRDKRTTLRRKPL